MSVKEDHTAESLSYQLLKNSTLMVLGRVAGLLTLIVAVPVIISHLGMAGYGVWESMLAISGIALVLQNVVRGTLLWRISISYGAQDVYETQRMVGIGVGTTLTLILFLVTGVWLIRDFLLVQLQIPGEWIDDTRWMLPYLIGIVLFGGVNQALAMVITGYQRAGQAALIQSGGLVATNLVSIGLLFAGYGLPAMLLGYVAGFVVMFALLYPVARSLCGRLSLLPVWPSPEEFTVLIPFAGLLLVSNLSFVLRDYTDKIVLSSMASPEMTGYFSMAQRVTSLIMQAHTVLLAPFSAAIGALYAVNDWDGIQKFYLRIGSWMSVLAGLVSFLIFTLREPLFVLWLGKDQPEAHVFLALLLFGMASAIIFTGAVTPLSKGIGRPGLETQYTLVTLGLTIVSKPLLIFAVGPVGSVASSALAWSLGGVYMLFLVHRKLNLAREMIRRNIGIFLVTLGMSLSGWLLMHSIVLPPGRMWAAIVLIGLGTVLTFCYFTVLVGLGLFRISFPRMTGFIRPS